MTLSLRPFLSRSPFSQAHASLPWQPWWGSSILPHRLKPQQLHALLEERHCHLLPCRHRSRRPRWHPLTHGSHHETTTEGVLLDPLRQPKLVWLRLHQVHLHHHLWFWRRRAQRQQFVRGWRDQACRWVPRGGWASTSHHHGGSQVQTIVDEGIYRLGFQRLSLSQIEKLLIKNWLTAARVVIKTLFPGERTLCDYVFGSSEHIKESCFAEITRDTILMEKNSVLTHCHCNICNFSYI